MQSAGDVRGSLVFFRRSQQSMENLPIRDELAQPLEAPAEPHRAVDPPARASWWLLWTLNDPEGELTLRAVLLGLVVGTVTTTENVYFSLKYGWTTTNNLSAAVLGHGALTAMDRVGAGSHRTSEGENCMLTTVAVASTCIVYSASLPFCVFAMSKTMEKYINQPGDSLSDTWDPGFWTLLAYCACMGFTGYFLALPLRQKFVVEEPLPFPYALSGAKCIRALHASADQPAQPLVLPSPMPKAWSPALGVRSRKAADEAISYQRAADREAPFSSGDSGEASDGPVGGAGGAPSRRHPQEFVAMMQGLIPGLGWSMLMWIFHGMEYWPLFGVKAKSKYSWKLDVTGTNLGRAFLIPERFIYSQMAGALVISGAILPVVVAKSGEWYAKDATGFEGPDAYIYMPAIFCIFVDSTLQLSRLMWKLVRSRRRRQQSEAEGAERQRERKLQEEREQPPHEEGQDGLDHDQQPCEASGWHSLRGDAPLHAKAMLDKVDDFNLSATGGEVGDEPNEQLVPTWVWVTGLVASSAVGVLAWPALFPGTSYFKAFVAAACAPLWSVGIVHAVGVTGSNMASYAGKFMIIIFASWYGGQSSSGMHHVVNSLALGSLSVAVIDQANDLVRDLKTAHLLGVSAMKTLVAQLIGAFASLFTSAGLYLYLIHRLSVPSEDLPAYLTVLYRELAFVFEAGFSALPKHCLAISFVFGAVALCTTLFEEWLQWRRPHLASRAPSAIAFGIGIVLGSGQSLMAVVGLLYKYYWRAVDPAECERVGVLYGAGLLAGDGLGGAIQCFLEAFGISHPMTVVFSDGD